MALEGQKIKGLGENEKKKNQNTHQKCQYKNMLQLKRKPQYAEFVSARFVSVSRNVIKNRF